MFTSILVPYVNERSETNVLESALAIAADLQFSFKPHKAAAHLAVLIGIEMPVMLPDMWSSSGSGILLCDAADAHAKTLQARIAQRTKGGAVLPEIRLEHAAGDSAAKMAALHARYSDISILPSASGTDSAIAHHYFSALLMHSGRPVLTIPEAYTLADTPKRVVIAWQPTRETTRAVHDAMPFLQAAETVDVLIVDPEVNNDAHGQDPGTDIATQLARHGLHVKVVCVKSSGKSVALAINGYLAHAGAHLLVAGGYGHSRLQEFLLGGVTRELLQTAAIPVLFSH